MILFLLVCVIGILGLVAARRAKTHTATDWVDLACVPWLFVISIAVVHVEHGVYMQGWCTGSYLVILIVGLELACATLLFVLGLAKFWPRAGQLGFPIRRVLSSIAVGAAIGGVESRAISGGWPTLLQLKVTPCGWYVQEISSVVMQEAVYRGRIMDAFGPRLRSAPWLILCQALVFAAFHIPGMLSRPQRYPNLLAALPDLGLIFFMGCVWGMLRLWRRDLWAPVAGHAVYNILVQTMTS